MRVGLLPVDSAAQACRRVYIHMRDKSVPLPICCGHPWLLGSVPAGVCVCAGDVSLLGCVSVLGGDVSLLGCVSVLECVKCKVRVSAV